MFFAKVSILLLAAVLVASESDLDKGLAIMACAKKAITGGVPSLDIPTHDPYVVLRRNITWSGELELMNVDLNLQNLTLAGLAKWNLSATQVSQDTDANAVFNFNLYWDSLVLAGQHNINVSDYSMNESYKGHFEVEWLKSNWIGSINVTKPTSSSNGTVNDLQIKWHVGNVNVTVDGFGYWDIPTEVDIETIILLSFNYDLIGNVVGDFIKMRLASVWWETGKVWELMDWCNSNSMNTNLF